MDRGERRRRTERVAHRRIENLGDMGRGQKVGWFRKWNLTCKCWMCEIGKLDDIRLQRMKDERRNLLSEVA
jgi:hypothetical protein